MTEAIEFFHTINEYFSFLELEFGFMKTREKINGNAFYDMEYRDSKRAISISYENIEDYLQIIIFLLKNGELPDYDDKSRTLHLNELNKIILPILNRTDININSKTFSQFKTKDKLKMKLLKNAKELRIILWHFDSIYNNLQRY